MRKHTLTPLAFIASSFLIASTQALSFRPNSLEIRQSSSCPTNFSTCGSSGFPSNFCCPSGDTCVTLASNTTLLCCPAGGDCSRINPITCDLSLEDVDQHPDSTIKTTKLDGKLSLCGTQCCPFGYSCSSNVCEMDKDQKLLAAPKPSSSSSTSPPTSSAAPPSTSASHTPPPDPTSDPAPTNAPESTSDPATPTTSTSSDTATPSETPTTSSAAIPLGGSGPESTCNNFPVPAVLAGFFPGMAAGILGAIACFCLLGARRRKTPKISSPSYQGTDFRTDFVRRYQPSSPGASERTQAERPATGIMRVKSLFRKSSTATSRLGPAPNSTPRGLGMGLPTSPAPPRLPLPTSTATATGAAAPPPVTPRLQRELSMESINIFADPSTTGSSSFQMAERRREDRRTAHTTFAEMMERAQLGDVRDGAPYVPGLPEPRLSPATYSPARNGSPVKVPGGARRSP